MEKKTLYKCPGNCGGVSPVPKNCGAADCSMYGQPLKPHEQCEGCMASAEKDEGNHLCANCKAL
ncbi:hypothetical protein HYW82_00040 [Candidatus Peregrinibacteria bacterium]|nr:hypothetical protein [Candidatus Peregrinibacteria bacterium]